MSSTLTAANALKGRAEAALGDLVDLVTLDGTGLKPATRAALVILPPEVAFRTWGERDTTFQMIAVAGPPDRPLAAWEKLDAILTALEDAQFNLATAKPAAFELAGSSTLPAYEITLHPLD